MKFPDIKLDSIRVQTARMIEIYTLIKDELEKNDELGLTKQTQAQLNHAIDTIHVNMRQLLDQLTAYQEENSLIHQEARELEEILSAVLQWQNEEGE